MLEDITRWKSCELSRVLQHARVSGSVTEGSDQPDRERMFSTFIELTRGKARLYDCEKHALVSLRRRPARAPFSRELVESLGTAAREADGGKAFECANDGDEGFANARESCSDLVLRRRHTLLPCTLVRRRPIYRLANPTTAPALEGRVNASSSCSGNIYSRNGPLRLRSRGGPTEISL